MSVAGQLMVAKLFGQVMLTVLLGKNLLQA